MADRPKSRQQLAEEDARDRFLADAGEHTMTVLHDQGLYRHLAFRGRSSFDWFDVITWPGHLTINSGHGTWTFARIDDMLDFFRSSRGLTRINPTYWGEKLLGGLDSGNQLTEEYDSDVFLAEVKRHVDDYVEGCGWPDELIEHLRTAVADQVTDELLDWTHEDGARQLVDEFDFRTATRRFRFEDAWEWDLHVVSYHFLWSCWAIVLAVQQYDASRAAAAGGGA